MRSPGSGDKPMIAKPSQGVTTYRATALPVVTIGDVLVSVDQWARECRRPFRLTN